MIILGLFLLLSNSVFSDRNFQGRKRTYAEFGTPQSSSSDQKQKQGKVIATRRRDSNDEIKAILEKMYKFKNDESTTRFKTITENKEEFPDEGTMSRVFRAYAMRRIVGGMETNITNYPYNAAVSRNGQHRCGGTIIDEQWVLTAGHCIQSAHDYGKVKLTAFRIRVGSSFRTHGGFVTGVSQTFFPSNYVPGSLDYDFALVRLDRPVPIGRKIAVLNLPSKDYVIRPGDMLIVTGWGSTHESGSYFLISDRLHFVPVPAMKLSDCLSAYGSHITPRMFCAGYETGGKDACNHDSGGPAVRDGVLVGIVSHGGKLCGDPLQPGVYSRVSEITRWVEQTIASNEASRDPELMEKMERARKREQDLQRFKAHVEDKKKRIKKWLQKTLTLLSFIKLAKNNLSQV